MEAEKIDQLDHAISSIDKLARLLVWIVGGVVALAVWMAITNMRLSAVEAVQAARIPVTDAFRLKEIQDDQKRDDLLSQHGATLQDHSSRITQIEDQWRSWSSQRAK